MSALLLAGCGGNQVLPAEIRSATATGPALTLEYQYGKCAELLEPQVQEDESRVTVTLELRRTGGDCPDIGLSGTVVVQLDDPLEDRELLDGSTDLPVPVRQRSSAQPPADHLRS